MAPGISIARNYCNTLPMLPGWLQHHLEQLELGLDASPLEFYFGSFLRLKVQPEVF